MSKFLRVKERVLVGFGAALLTSAVSLVGASAQAAQGQAQMPGMPGMPAAAQNVGNVLGTVTKASGGPVVGATAIALNPSNGTQYSASTDYQGRYSLPSLPDRKSTRLNSSHLKLSRMPSSA